MACGNSYAFRKFVQRYINLIPKNACFSGVSNSKKKPNISFENHADAFKSKTNFEVLRALLVLRVCGYESFVNNSLEILKVSKKFLGNSLVNLAVRKTFYNQFVGGHRSDELTKVVKRLSLENVKPMIVCTMEEDVGESSGLEDIYDRNLERVLSLLRLIQSMKADSPLMQLKMTSLIAPDVLARLSEKITTDFDRIYVIKSLSDAMECKENATLEMLSKEDEVKISNAVKIFAKIGRLAVKSDIRLLVDAEFSYVNPAISLLALTMMNVLNKKKPFVWNTYQCYLKTALNDLNEDMIVAKNLGLCFGVKLVRGAYISTEYQMAQKLMKNPVWETYKETNVCYNKALLRLLQETKIAANKLHFVAATHNEESILYAIDKMKEFKMENSCAQVTFAQLHGMCDQITFPLASAGYNVYKSVPFGPLEEAMPYLARRATENQSVLAGARKERELLRKNLKARILMNN